MKLRIAGFLSPMTRRNPSFKVTHKGTFHRISENALCAFEPFEEQMFVSRLST